MIIDCGSCTARTTSACDDCIVTALCGPEGVLELDADECSAIDAMSAAGLVSPIRLVQRTEPDPGGRSAYDQRAG